MLKFECEIFGLSLLEKRLVLTIEPSDYMDMLNACDSIKLYVKGLVTETRQSFATQKDIELVKPTINVTVSQFGDCIFHLMIMQIS